MHNNLNMIKILSTIYLPLAVLFLSFPLYWHHESWVHKALKSVHGTLKTGSTSNLCFSTTIRPLRTIFNCINFYTSALKLLFSLIGPGKENINQQIYYIYSSIICFTERYISANNVFS